MIMIENEMPPNQNTRTNEHPWAHRIKDVYFNRIKYAHNSIRNPEYPKKEKTVIKDNKGHSNTKLIRFTVIGDRITKEYIYCVKLVTGLHRHRKMIFEAPVIRGTTTVEWPVVLNDLKVRYGGMAYCLQSSVAVLINNKFLGGEKELKDLIESKFSYHLSLDYYKESINEFAKFVRGSGRSFVYLKISVETEDIGNLIFMLYDDVLPYTCANFLRLCKETKGGYSGTPIHRVVKDGWIQGGGFGLKETDLSCENFIIPHDRRGVLGMANSGLHTECSTQFYVLLQPAPWMARKFVAFGQLVEGKNTLDKIEAVPTWYESPTSQIVIYKAGIFNMECQDIMINKGTNEFIDKHIEDLNELGEIFYDKLLDNVFLMVQLKEIERLKKEEEEGGASAALDESASGLRETKRFNRRKEDIEKQLQKTKGDQSNRPSTAVSRVTDSVVQRFTSTSANNDFDVETYEPEYEEIDYQHQSIDTPSLVVKPKIPFYIPLTDVLYPDEKDSNFDLKRFLQGDYCLESDLKADSKKLSPRNMYQNASEMFDIDEEEAEVDSSEEREMQKSLKNKIDRVSYAGGIVRSIAKGLKFNEFDDEKMSERLTDDQLRRLRLAKLEQKSREQDKKVSIKLPPGKTKKMQIKRQATGFVRAEDHASIQRIHDRYKGITDKEEERLRKVRISESTTDTKNDVRRRVTAFVRKAVVVDNDDVGVDNDDDKIGSDDDDESNNRQSVFVRLFEDLKGTDELPTLKDYKPTSEFHQKNLLTFSSNYRIKVETESKREQQRYIRQSLTAERDSIDRALTLQHGKRIFRKISSDYVKTIDHIEHKIENSIRSVEFAKTRPSMSVAEYKEKNRKYQEEHRSSLEKMTGHRLPGRTSLRSSRIHLKEKHKAHKPAHHREVP